MMNKEAVERALLFVIWACIVLVLLVPLIVTGRDTLLLNTQIPIIRGTIFPFIVGKAVFAHLVIEVALGAWLILANLNPSYRPPRSWLLIIFAVYLMISFMAGIFGVSLQRSLWSTYERMQGLVDLTHWFVFTVIVASVVRSIAQWRYLLNVNLAVSLFVAFLGIGQRYDVQIISFFDFITYYPRPSATFGNPSFAAAYLMVNVFIAAGLLGYSLFTRTAPAAVSTVEARRRRRRRVRADQGQINWSYVRIYFSRIFWTVSIAINFWVMTLSGTRGAVTGLAIGLFLALIFYALNGRIKGMRVAAAGATSLLVILLLVFLVGRNTAIVQKAGSSNVLVNRMASVSLDDASVRSRIQSIPIALKGFAERPLLGWGPENYLIVYGRYYTVEEGVTTPVFDQAHNKPLEELTTKGILGFASYLVLWAALMWIIQKVVRKQEANIQIFILFIGAALVGYFVQNLFLFDTPATVMQLMLLIGLIAFIEVSTRQDNLNEGAAVRSARDPISNVDEETSSVWLARFGTTVLLWKARVTDQLAGRVLRNRRKLGSPVRHAIVLSLALTVISAGAYFTSYKPYRAAITFLRVTEPRISVGEALVYFEETIESFRPLANYPRLVMIRSLTNAWDGLEPSEMQIALAAVERELPEAIGSEPENWRIYLALAEFYMRAASIDPDNMARAKDYFEIGSELAPGRPEVFELAEKFANLQIERQTAQ